MLVGSPSATTWPSAKTTSHVVRSERDDDICVKGWRLYCDIPRDPLIALHMEDLASRKYQYMTLAGTAGYASMTALGMDIQNRR